MRWMLFHERSSVFTSSAFLQTLKFIWHWKRGRMSKKPQFYVILVFASILFAALFFFCFLFFVTWPQCITQVLTDVFWAFSCCSGFFNINGFSIPHMQAVSLTTQAGCQVHTLMWENLVCTALCREVQVIDMFVNKSQEEIVDCKRILIKK